MFNGIIRAVTEVTDELRCLHMSLKDIVTALSDSDTYEGLRLRLDAIEGPLQAKLGEVEGLLLKAEGMKHAARAAEQRARGFHARAEALSFEEPRKGDESGLTLTDDELRQLARSVPVDNAGGGGEGELQPVPDILEELRARKFANGPHG